MDELLYCFKLADPSGEFEPATELLDALELDYSSIFNRENGEVWHTVYSGTSEAAQEQLARVNSMLPLWREMEVELIPGEIFELKKSEWADAWKKYFTPVEISDTLLVTPQWITPEARPGQTVLRIDTGMSFGTGQHPTTFYCLKKIHCYAKHIGQFLGYLQIGQRFGPFPFGDGFIGIVDLIGKFCLCKPRFGAQPN